MEIAGSDQRKKLQKEYAAENTDPEAKVRRVTEIYDQLGIKVITESLANEFFRAAVSLLDKVNIPQERKCELVQITGSLIGRDH
jgi:geranylgeranyl diphosphate synthase type II